MGSNPHSPTDKTSALSSILSKDYSQLFLAITTIKTQIVDTLSVLDRSSVLMFTKLEIFMSFELVL